MWRGGELLIRGSGGGLDRVLGFFQSEPLDLTCCEMCFLRCLYGHYLDCTRLSV
jgi:hypothetical protein